MLYLSLSLKGHVQLIKRLPKSRPSARSDVFKEWVKKYHVVTKVAQQIPL
jgi:hypothetical protein